MLILGVYHYLPYYLEQNYVSKAFKDANMTVKKIEYGKDYFEYVEGGEGETILLVHGFFGSKNYWIPYCRDLSKKYHIVAVDLPGHGGSSRPEGQSYKIDGLAKNLQKFVDLKSLEKFHIIGTSMGGGVAAVYSKDCPGKVISLTMLNPMGIDLEEKSELQNMLKKGKNILFPNSLTEFDEAAVYFAGKPYNLNIFFKNHVLKKMMRDYPFYKKIFNELLSSTPLDKVLPKIKANSLIIIGQKDRIINPASFEVFVKKIPKIKAKRIKEGSHTLTGRYFEEALKTIKEFLKENEGHSA